MFTLKSKIKQKHFLENKLGKIGANIKVKGQINYKNYRYSYYIYIVKQVEI